MSAIGTYIQKRHIVKAVQLCISNLELVLDTGLDIRDICITPDIHREDDGWAECDATVTLLAGTYVMPEFDGVQRTPPPKSKLTKCNDGDWIIFSNAEDRLFQLFDVLSDDEFQAGFVELPREEDDD